MEAITYLLTIAICFLGLVAGIVVSYMAKEELEPGASYFLWLKRILVAVVLGSLIYLHRNNIYYIIGLLVWMAASEIFIRNDILIYSLFGIAISESIGSQPVFIVSSVALFLYGLPTAAILIERYIRKGWVYTTEKLLSIGLFFVVVSTLLYFT